MPHDVELEDGLIDIAQTCGPFGWGVIHHAAETFPCAPCAEEGGSLMRAAHDLINFRIGLQIMLPDDIDRWHPVMEEAHNQVAHELDWQKMEAAQDRPAAEIRDEIASTREVLNSEPANTLIRFVKRSGKNKGEIVDFTKRQFRELLGKDPPAVIVKPDGKIPWELALDVIASELGYPSDEALKNGIERSIKERRRIESLERELAVIPETVCSTIDPGEVPCLEWEGEFCRQKEITCDGTVITAIRSPIDWSIHITGEDEFPDQDSQIDVARRAGDASKVLKELAANPGERVAAQSQVLGTPPSSGGDPRLRVDWCNLDDSEIDAAWNWRPMRDAIALARGLGSPVEVCRIGFEPGTLQMTVTTFGLEADFALAVQIKKLLGRAGTQIASPFGVKQLVFQVVLPGAEPSELAFEPQEVILTPARPEGSQATLFSAQRPVCSTAEAERLERCVRELKADPGIDEPFGVCVESIGCKVA